MQNENHSESYCYYRAQGRSLDAIKLHRMAVHKAVEDVRAFVMLCGAERALGGPRISGLHFAGPLPRGWVRNASAPHMAFPDTETTRGMSFARKMSELRIPDTAEFGMMIGAEALPSSLDPTSPVITVTWPSYEAVLDGWIIRCPVDKDGNHAVPPDAVTITRDEYERVMLAPSFNLLASDTEEMDRH